ncbi:MAG TPA: F0F1 ATP synthase subunit B [Candidatus Acutalibacter pullicola]|uniref:ATP synthase subunit b n=1 Tax=Candidatus Acutalibacter pullicola TaxID=2838417 RepID=A0A9D2SFS3_9FIRM|nr:F0F1 ATP synthase subunit B [Candidatus Acutalibacter pullicola]
MLSLDWDIVWTIVNLLILFLLLKHFLFKPITKMMESRTAEIENNLKDAEDQKQKAAELTAQYEEKLQGAHAEAAQIVSEAKQRGQKEYDAILKSAAQDAQKEQERSRADLEREREEMLRGVQENVTELVLLTASKLSQKELDQESDRKLVDAFLAEGEEQP